MQEPFIRAFSPCARSFAVRRSTRAGLAVLVLGTLLGGATLTSASCASDDAAQKKPDPEAVAQASRAAAKKTVHDLAAAWWAMVLERYPEMATAVGEHAYDGRLTDTTPAARRAFNAQVEAFRTQAQAAISALAAGDLDEQDALTARILKSELDAHLAAEALNFWTLDFHQMGGPQADFSYFITVQHPKATAADVNNMLARYVAFGPYIDGYIETERAALANHPPPQVIAARVLKQLEAIVAEDVKTSSFFLAADTVLPDGAAEERAVLGDKLRAAATDVIRPAFVRYRDFVRDEVVPKARPTVGVSSLPQGPAMYAEAARDYTTTTLTPDEIHQMGLDELERIEGEMKKLADERGFVGDVASFLAALRADRTLYAPSRDALLATFRTALKRADAALPTAFNTLPKLPYTVAPLDAAREKDAPAAYYQPGSPKDGRGGVFVANLYRFEERPVFNSSVLAFHEAVPGHHLQIALAQEIDALPRFRAEGGNTAFVEGWALYSERLANELGLYESLEARVGYLGFAAWRASRLVVDTGLHAKGWTRAHAVDFLAAHTTLGPVDVENEIDRYIAWPGQALGYMVGCLKILELREAAKARQGERFSLPAFHDAVLLAGAIPLDVLQSRVERLLP